MICFVSRHFRDLATSDAAPRIFRRPSQEWLAAQIWISAEIWLSAEGTAHFDLRSCMHLLNTSWQTPARVAAPAPVTEVSESVPFLAKPENKDLESLAGYVGFDPLGFSNNFDAAWLQVSTV